MVSILSKEELKALEITKEDIEREEKLEKIAKLGGTVTELSRIVYVDEFDLEKGQVIDSVGLHWTDLNDEYSEGYKTDDFEGIEVIFFVNDVEGFKVPYFHEMWAEDNDIDYETEMKLVDMFSDFYEMLGTTENSYREAEVLVSNDKKFKIVELFEANDETDYYEVHLEEV